MSIASTLYRNGFINRRVNKRVSQYDFYLHLGSSCITIEASPIAMGCRLCQKSVFLIFTEDTGIYARCWYLRAMLVFMQVAGIYERCWYLWSQLWTMLVFVNDAVIYGSGIYG